MALEVSEQKRIFKFSHNDEDVTLDDPNPEMTTDEVRKFLSGKYPELTNANITGPKIENDQSVYSFSTAIGKKG